MNTNSPAAGGAPAAAKGGDNLDFVDRFRSNPGAYVTRVVVIAVAALAAILAYRMWRASQDQKTTDVSTELHRAVLAPDPVEKAAILNDLKKKTEGGPIEAHRLRELAVAYRDVAHAAKTNEEKKEAWRNCLAAATSLQTSFPNSVWAQMPTRPGSEESAPVATAIKSLAEKQLEWLDKHPYTGAPTPDSGAKVVFELENGKKVVLGKFYSSIAPYAVQNFFNLARDGYFVGTSIGTLRRGVLKSSKQYEQSNVGVELGDPMTKVTPEDRTDDGVDPSATNDLPYTLPEESGNLPIVRGSVVMRQNFTAGGYSPTRCTIYFDEVSYGAGTPFADVTEGLDVLEEIAKGDTDPDRPERLKSMTKVVNVTVEGSVANPPTGRALPPYDPSNLPEATKPK
jgi:cyclophilin family peptidyl-prolyl cis-trans isomerase